jgi:hypothetical protein
MKKSTKWAVYVLLPIIIMLSAVFLLWEQVSYFAIRKAAEHYAGRANITLEISGIAGSPLSKTTITGLSVRPAAGEPQIYQFKAESITCTYNLWDLQKGLYPFLEGCSCTAAAPEFSYDLRAETPESPEGEEPVFFVPEVMPGVEVENGRVNLAFEDGVLELQGIDGNLRSGPGAVHELQLDVRSLRFSQGSAVRIETGFTALLQYADTKLSIASFEAGEEQITAAGSIDLGRIDKGYTGFALDVSFAESLLHVSGDLDNRILRTHVRTENFDIGELQKRLGGIGWDISGRIMGEAELAYDLEAEEDYYSGSFGFDVQECRVHGVDIKTLVIKGDSAGGALRIAKAEAATSGNRAALRNVSIPVGLLQGGEVFPILGGMQAEFAAEIGDALEFLQVFALEGESLPEGLAQHSLVLEGKLADGILLVTKADAETPGNHLLLSNVSVPVGLLQRGEVLPILGGTQAEFNAEIDNGAQILKLFALGNDLLPEELTPHSMSLKGRVAGGILYLDTARGDAPELSLSINRGEIPVPASAESFASLPVNLAARVESANLHAITRLFTDIKVSGRASADMTITGSVKEPRVAIKLTGAQLGYKEVQLGSLALQGNIQLLQEKPGTVKDIRFAITEFNQTNDSGRLALLSPAEGRWQPGSFTASGAFQVDGDGEVAIKIVQPPGQDLAIEIRTRGLDSDGWLATFLGGSYFFHDADIEADLAGLPEHPQVRVEGSMGASGWEGMPFPLSGKFRLQYSPRGVEISEFSWTSHDSNEITLTGFLPYDPMAPEPFLDGELTLDGHIDFPSLEDIKVFLEPLGISKGSVALDAEISGTWQQLLGRLQLGAEGIEVPDKLKEYFTAPISLSCDLTAEPGVITINNASLESADYAAQASGFWQHGYTVAALLQKRGAELQGEVLLDAALQMKDLNFLRNKLTWLRRLDGNTEVKLHVSGPASDPAIRGTFFLNNGEISHTFNLPMLSDVNLEGEFDAESITVTMMQGEAGGSPVSLNGRIKRVPEGIDVNLQLEGKNVLLLRNNDMLLRGDVQLEASGPLERLVITGFTGLTGGYYNKNIDFLGKIGTGTAPASEGGTFLFSFGEQPLKNAILNIKITTLEPFRIRNNLVRGTLRPELSLKGTGELPFLMGVIYIDPSRVLLPSGRLQVQSGLVRFLENDPDRPQLDLIASSKVLGYDINVVMQGPLDEPVITLSSSPALPNDDLLLLLLTGQPPKEEEITAQGTLGKGTTNVMVYLGRDFLSKWLEGEAGTSDESILDRFELDYGRAVTKTGEQTVETTFRLSDQSAGKKRVYYLSGEKDRYDAYNYGLKVVFRFE